MKIIKDLEGCMKFLMRKLLILKNDIENKEAIANKFGKKVCSTDIKLKNNINDLLNKLKTIQ